MSTSKDIINYTDYHDVDEDMKTISVYGGFWIEGELIGVTHRNVLDAHTTSGYHVASSTVEFLNYTDQHDVDEDVRTIGKQGGRWIAEAGNGVCLRHLIDDITSEQDLVASRKKQELTISLLR